MSSHLGSTRLRALLVVLAGLSWVALEAGVSEPTDNAAVNEIRFAEAFKQDSQTGGIQEAIDDCGTGLDSIGCIVVLPRGLTRYSS